MIRCVSDHFKKALSGRLALKAVKSQQNIYFTYIPSTIISSYLVYCQKVRAVCDFNGAKEFVMNYISEDISNFQNAAFKQLLPSSHWVSQQRSDVNVTSN